jgi:acetone carboxylase, gamma subunit
MRIHEYLEIATDEKGERQIRCLRCDHRFCGPEENYKLHALVRVRELADVPLRSLRSGEPPFVRYQEFICPGCGTLLEVDAVCPALDADDPIVWDIQILENAEGAGR